MSRHGFRLALSAAVLFSLAPRALAATLYVATNGVDGPDCGPKAQACRSITRAIANAAAGDTIIVGAGRYGDLDSDGTLGETGEEIGSPGCGCMLSINKPLRLASSDGAAATIIDARRAVVDKNVLIITEGAEFGKPGKGFTVTSTAGGSRDGIVIDAADIRVRGNQVIRDVGVQNAFAGTGIRTLAGTVGILLEGNQVNGWGIGIRAEGNGTTVRKNQVSLNATGIRASGSTPVIANVAIGNITGLVLLGSASAVGNALLSNHNAGILTSSVGVVEKNNVFGNVVYGVENNGVVNLPATRNFWGAATGPGPDPADYSHLESGGTTIVAPFATKPFKVKARIKP